MLLRVVGFLERVIALIGHVAALFVLAMIGLIVYEMISRGAFGVSAPWVGDLVSWLLAGLIFLGGPWVLTQGKFVRVDALFTTFSPRTQAIVDTFISSIFFALLIGVLIINGYSFAERSFLSGETSATGAWDGPIWVAKAMVPLGAALLVIAWLLHLARSWEAALTDRPRKSPDGEASPDG